ncbi:hypothetical protein OB905_11310 [Halobacteria archaeon AArc-dxtr1]|nr:hypothetical protein [Halobacteria archaeon AArc-dxtr1]
MSRVLLAIIVLIPLAWHLGLIAVVYYDTGRMPLERRKWLLIVGLIPIFGFFMYLFERSELDYDPEEDPYAGGKYNVHPSRADDFPLAEDGEDVDRERRRVDEQREHDDQ